MISAFPSHLIHRLHQFQDVASSLLQKYGSIPSGWDAPVDTQIQLAQQSFVQHQHHHQQQAVAPLAGAAQLQMQQHHHGNTARASPPGMVTHPGGNDTVFAGSGGAVGMNRNPNSNSQSQSAIAGIVEVAVTTQDILTSLFEVVDSVYDDPQLVWGALQRCVGFVCVCVCVCLCVCVCVYI